MTDIDTAAIRAWIRNPKDDWMLSFGDVADLCDALDAARAELRICTENRDLVKTRAEAAEVHNRNYLRVIKGLELRAEAAEASEVKMAKLMCDATSRAEAAEADLIHAHETADIYLARAEAAEARITAALAMGPDHLSVQAFDALGGYDE
jgi:hypothetical protein